MASSTSTKQVLVIDDDQRLLMALRLALTAKGFAVSTAADAGEALRRIEEATPDVIVLDVMMPVIGGLQLCHMIQEKIDAPVLMLTALDGVTDKIAGLEAGADDYLVKPFDTEELTARLRALLRRGGPREKRPMILAYADLVLDAHLWTVERKGRSIELTSREFRILEAFLREPRRVFSREDILAAAWGTSGPIESNAVDVHVASLRQKLEASSAKRLIQTIRGVGYSLRE
jgi:two-component system response regulator MprA